LSCERFRTVASAETNISGTGVHGEFERKDMVDFFGE
jgi:methionine synthase II (cobalamin-independent)